MKYLFLLLLVSLTNQMFAAEDSAAQAETVQEKSAEEKWFPLGQATYKTTSQFVGTVEASRPSFPQGILIRNTEPEISHKGSLFYEGIESVFDGLEVQAQGSQHIESLKQAKAALKAVLHPDVALQAYDDTYQRCSLSLLCARGCQETFKVCWVVKIPGEEVRVFQTKAGAEKVNLEFGIRIFMANQKFNDGSCLGDECMAKMKQEFALKSPEERVPIGKIERTMKIRENCAFISPYVARVVRPNYQHHWHS